MDQYAPITELARHLLRGNRHTLGYHKEYNFLFVRCVVVLV